MRPLVVLLALTALVAVPVACLLYVVATRLPHLTP
jgi:hypothetical protein